MSTWLSWRPSERHAQALRAALRRGTRVSHHLFSVVGGAAVLVALALWLLPNVRGTLAARLMPFVSAAVKAGPARLLTGHPLPAFGPSDASQDDSLAANAPPSDQTVAADASSVDTATEATMTAAADTARNAPSPIMLAKLIPTQRVAPDARDNSAPATNRQQALVANFVARRYHVAQEPVTQLVKAAYDTGRQVGLDPLLLLAVMAIESGFNPYAESGVGAQGLMQVMAKVHSDKFDYFGGPDAALRPLVNIQVGALVLKDCIARGGSLAGGLRLYVGSASQDDGGYGAKVVAERNRLRAIAQGRNVSIYEPQAPARPAVTTAAASPSGAKRVHATLDSAHALAVKTASVPKDTQQSDASTDASKHDASPELGT